MPLHQLVTTTEVKAALGLPESEHDQDAKLGLAVQAAEDAIRTYLGRNFEEAADDAVAAEREFVYDDSGLIVVDDFKHGSLVGAGVNGLALADGVIAVEPRPSQYPVAWWIEVNQRRRRSSPEMGFTRNEDVLAREGRFDFHERSETIAVTAIWGWDEVPHDVKRAALWTAIAFQENPRAYISESIAGYSRTSTNPMVEGIPPRAQAILEPHRKAS